jgi:hypothetical protein
VEKSNFALRLLPSLYKTAQRVADREDCSLNQLINVALAEKLAVMEEDHWQERKDAAAKRPKSEVLKRLADNEPPRNGDEISPVTRKKLISLKVGRVKRERAARQRASTASGRLTKNRSLASKTNMED